MDPSRRSMAAQQSSPGEGLLQEADKISKRVSEDILTGWKSFQAREEALEELRLKQRLAGLQQGKKSVFYASNYKYAFSGKWNSYARGDLGLKE